MEGFIANLYEFFGGLVIDQFSNDMFNYKFYIPVFILMLVSVTSVTGIYYYVINHPRVNRWWHWLLFNLGTVLLNFILAWVISSDKLIGLYNAQGMNCPYDWTHYLVFSLAASFWTLIFFFVFSFVIKWGSRNCKHTPFL
jgi:hypothetical protein